MPRTCPDCDEDFEADADWKRLCLRCWKARRTIESGSVDDTLQRRVNRLASENSRLRRELEEARASRGNTINGFDLPFVRLLLQ